MFPPHIVYPALRSILVNRLQKAVNSYEKTLYSGEPSNLRKSWNQSSQGNQPVLIETPLKRIEKENQICYASAFALRLAKLWQQPALDIANYIAKTLDQENSLFNSTVDHHFGDIWQNCSVYIAPPGWIYLELHRNSVAVWLQIAVNLLPHKPVFSADTAINSTSIGVYPHPVTEKLLRSNVSKSHDTIRLFEGLHSYARCSSLLRLGEQAGLVQLNSLDRRLEEGWRIADPSPLPWLHKDGNLCCKHPSEQRLITQLIDIADELDLEFSSSSDRVNHSLDKTEFGKFRFSKMLQCLSQAFQAFHRDCQIFGEILKTDRSLAQVRCGLILVTQTLLHCLIQAGWAIEPPSEL